MYCDRQQTAAQTALKLGCGRKHKASTAVHAAQWRFLCGLFECAAVCNSKGSERASERASVFAIQQPISACALSDRIRVRRAIHLVVMSTPYVGVNNY